MLSVRNLYPRLLSIVSLGALLHFEACEGCTVTINNGTILGVTLATENPDKSVCGYLGIPYAAPPLGSLRFTAPEPTQPWGDSPLNATSPPDWCPQAGSPPPGIGMSEDCLKLNIYVPGNSTPTNLPVMLWIYGGSYRTGSSSMYPHTKLLARQEDVVLVVINYRIGLLGFLGTGDAVSPGNYGLKDQHFAIRWVSENIAAFGGDPNRVTLFGESAGAFSTTYQFLNPLNKDLIHGVIAQSGSALSIYAIDRNPLLSAQTMAARLGCFESGSSTTETVECLRHVPWESIIDEQSKFSLECYANLTFPYASMTPVIEPNVPGAFLTQEPEQLLREGDLPDIPVLLGATLHDGSLLTARYYLGTFGPDELHKNPEYLRDDLMPNLLELLQVGGDVGNRGAVSSLEALYFTGGDRDDWNNTVMPGLIDILSVFAFKSAIHTTADILSRRNRTVYLYSFEHYSDNNLWPIFVGPGAVGIPVEHGVSHGDDLMYLFDFNVQFSIGDQTFSDLFCDLWLNFGVYGNPTPTPSENYEPWPAYSIAEEPFMILNGTPIVAQGFRTTWFPHGSFHSPQSQVQHRKKMSEANFAVA